MLIDTFLHFVLLIVDGMLSILPAGGTMPALIGTAVGEMFKVLRSFDFIIPYSDLIACLYFGLVWELFVLGWKFVHWLMRKVPVVGIK